MFKEQSKRDRAVGGQELIYTQEGRYADVPGVKVAYAVGIPMELQAS